MNKKTIKIVLFSTITLCFGLTVGGLIYTTSQQNISNEMEVEAYVPLDVNGFAYVTDGDVLRFVSGEEGEDAVNIASNVIDFRIALDKIVYYGKQGYSKGLFLYDMGKKETVPVRQHYINDFIVNNESLFLIEGKNILRYSLVNNKEEVLVSTPTNDIFFMFANEEKLVYSYLDGGISTVYSLDLKTGDVLKVGENITDVTFNEGEYFGLNSSMDFFKIGEDWVMDIIEGLPMLAYSRVEDNFLFIDTDGSLNVLDSKKSIREIATSVSSFKVIDGNVYYMSNRDGNSSIYMTQIKGRHKTALVEDARKDMRFEMF